MDTSKFDANYRKRTKESILNEIEWRLERMNYKIQGAIENELIEDDSAINLRIEDINTFSGRKKLKSDEFLKPIKNLDKEELIRYATELRLAEKNEIWTEEGQLKLERQYAQAKETLIERYTLEQYNLSDTDYHNIVSTINQYREELSTTYESRQIVPDLAEYTELHSTKISDILKEVIKEHKSQGFSQSEFREKFRGKLKEALENQRKFGK